MHICFGILNLTAILSLRIKWLLNFAMSFQTTDNTKQIL